MKKFLVALVALSLFFACEPVGDVVFSVTNIFVNPTAVTIVEGDTISIVATVSPNNATNKEVIWTSSDASVASVSKSGLISGNNPGKATITAISDDGGFKAECQVTVEAKVYPVESVSLNKTEMKLVEGDFETLIATVLPDNASNKRVSWTSTKPLVAGVTSGLVEALSPGVAEIYVTTNDGSKTAVCTVTVEEKVYHVEAVLLNEESLELTEGDTYSLTAEIYPEKAKNKNVSWSSSDEAVVTVDKGVISAVGAGKATVTVTTEENSCTASCEVTVNAQVFPVEAITLDCTADTLVVGDTLRLTATVYPSNATNKNLTWNTTKSEVVTVDSNGLVTAVGVGDAYIYVVPEEGDCYAKTLFHVVDSSSQEDPEGPEDPEDSEDPGESDGPEDPDDSEDEGEIIHVTGITFADAEGECEKSITSQGSTIYKLEVGKSINIPVVFTPADATNKALTWDSSFPQTATVDENGNVTALDENGSITEIIATSVDNESCSAMCLVQVVAASQESGE